jgi:hypothetical protein
MPLQIAALPIDDLVARMEYSGGNITYRGCHRVVNIATSDKEWLVWKYTWTGSDLTMIQGPLRGSWEDRASLGWS